MVVEETEWDDLMEKEEVEMKVVRKEEETEWDALGEEIEWDGLKEVEESVVRWVGKEKGVEEEQMKKELEGKKAMVVEERLVVAARTVVAAVKLKEEELKGPLAVREGERSQVV